MGVELEAVPALMCCGCICDGCFHRRKGDCPYGECYDDRRAKDYPYNALHKEVRKSWSRWNEHGEQEHWCRGGSFYISKHCESYVRFRAVRVVECIESMCEIFQDGSMECGFGANPDCNRCYEEFEHKLEERENE